MVIKFRNEIGQYITCYSSRNDKRCSPYNDYHGFMDRCGGSLWKTMDIRYGYEGSRYVRR